MQHRMRCQRHGATAAHGTADSTLSGNGQPSDLVCERLQYIAYIVARSANFDTQSALTGGGQHFGDIKNMPDTFAQPEPLEACSSQHNAGVVTFVQFAQAGVQVAAQWLNLQVGAQMAQQHRATQT